MFVAHPRTRHDQYESIPEIWWVMEKFSWYLEGHLTAFRESMKDVHSSKCYTKSDKWWEEEWFTSIEGLVPIREITTEIPDRDRHSEDRSDERMRWWGRDTEIPGSEVPDDGGDEEWEDNADTISERRRGDRFEWEEVYYSHSDRDPTDEDPQSIHAGGEENWVSRFHRISIDNGRDSIRGIMESIDELECTDEKETEPERDINNFHKKYKYNIS